MAVEYSKTSPYFATTLYGQFLDIINFRQISKLSDDVYY
jgi:hypothetical protein